VTSSRQ